MEQSSKIFYGVLALGVVAAHVWGASQAGPQGMAFGLFTSLTLGGSLVCLWERSVVRSAFALLATFAGIAGFFVLLHSDYLAVAQLLIYAGGILALLLFGVMLTPPDMTERKLPRVLSGLALLAVATGWLGVKVATTVRWATRENPGYGSSNAERIGVGFLRADQYVVPFELAAVVLTVALVAAVYIARRRRVDIEPVDLGAEAAPGPAAGSGSAAGVPLSAPKGEL